jgi:glutamate racemase
MNSPILVYDLGIGGVAVLRKFLEHHPEDDYIYYADDWFEPDLRRSPNRVADRLQVAFQVARDYGACAFVCACHTASAVIHSTNVADDFDIPLIDMVNIASDRLAEEPCPILCTPMTDQTGVYRSNSIGCPLLAPIIETGWWDEELPFLIRHYWNGVAGNESRLVLGCTHYSLVADVFRETLPDVEVVDPTDEFPWITNGFIERPYTDRDSGSLELVSTSGRDDILNRVADRVGDHT